MVSGTSRLEKIEASFARYDERLEELELALAAKDREIDLLKADRQASQLPATIAPESQSHNASSASQTVAETRSSRRNLLRGGAVAAGAALAGSLATAGPVAADDGDNIVIGTSNEAQTETLLETTGAGLQGSGNIFTVSDNSGGSFYPSAIGGYAYGDAITNGVYAYSATRADSDPTTGHAIVSWRDQSARSNLWMRPVGSSPNDDTHSHQAGECVVDSDSTFWFCVASGTPGTWRKIAGSSSSGSMHAIAPARVYDSRFTGDPISTGANRTISVANARDPFTGSVTISDVVPQDATAVFFNLAITQTTGVGYLLIAPGGTTEITASTINWTSAGTTLANGSMSILDASRQLTVLAGGGGSTHFVVDINGYTL